MKFPFLCLLATLSLVLVACDAKKSAAAPPAAVVVAKPTTMIRGETAKAEEHVFPRFLRVTGQLAAKSDAVVAADTMGKVVEASVERGSVVKAGDVLARLDERQPKLALAEASAAVDVAKTRLALAKQEQTYIESQVRPMNLDTTDDE
jgi:multidrug efflux pump subunit AcrA (membrane-fusion protein)